MSFLIFFYSDFVHALLSLWSNYLWHPFIIVFSLYRVSIFQASNAYLHLRGNGLKISFEFVKEMPRAAIPVHHDRFDMAPFIGQLPFVWAMELLFPV